MSTTNRRGNLENSSYRMVDPGKGSINLILSGSVVSSGSEGDYNVDVESIRNSVYKLEGVGFQLEPYRDTLQDCREIWIPLKDSNGIIHKLQFEVSSRTSYREWMYLWNTGSSVLISGSWLADGFVLGEDPYFIGSLGEELDYSCVVPVADQSTIFVEYIPTGFEYASNYNATLNNAQLDSSDEDYYISSSIKLKKYTSDDHKNSGIGGLCAGELNIDAGTDKKTVQRYEYLQQFISRSSKLDSDNNQVSLQTLDLAFVAYRAISASVYVDRERYNASASIESVWKDLQENNTDDSELVYFTPRSVLNIPAGQEITPNHLVGEVQDDGARTTIPAVGQIAFKVQGHIPVRHSRATIYSPFINTVYRTDDYGIITEACSGSVS